MNYLFVPFDFLSRIYSVGQDPFKPGRLKKGKEYAKNSHCVIGSLLRDAELSFKYSKRLIQKFSKIFKTVDVIILENESKDKTRILWEKFAKNHGLKNVKIFVESPKSDYYPPTVNHNHTSDRIKKMVKLRNQLLKKISEKFRKVDYDKYIFITDLDIKGHLEKNGIYDTFYYFLKSRYDGIGCNGILFWGIFYFDEFAYHENRESKYRVHSGIDVPINEGLFKVLSSFSGGVFYRYDKIINLKYKFKKERGEVLCEHLSLHEKIKMCINTNMKYYIETH